MCNIWERNDRGELPIDILSQLPRNLKHIDITGGEPFLHSDIVGIVKALRSTCPKARLLITTNGLAPALIERQLSTLFSIAPQLAFRLSLDGIGAVHDQVRGVPGAFDSVMKSIKLIQTAGFTDVGVIFTLTNKNSDQLLEVYNYTRKNRLAFSLNFLHDSPVYFGEGHRGKIPTDVKKLVKSLVIKQLVSSNPQDWGKALFNWSQLGYQRSHKRPIPCGAANTLLYIDPSADMYACHFKPWKLGNLHTQTFEEIWGSNERLKYCQQSRRCNDCWMMCTVKPGIRL
jgi:MoaA/NifB/PqqE/SkfB family radical SAM enzyme